MKILIAEYFALMRDGLGILVRELATDAALIQAETFEDVLAAYSREEIDLALIDFNLPGFDGIASIRALRDRAPRIPVVLVATSERWSDACSAIEAGARGYIPKSASSAIMIAALRLILSGGIYLPPLIRQPGFNDARGGNGPAEIGPDADGGADRRLTPRQQEVLRCLARGQSNKEIAYQLGLSQGTVKIHIAAIFRAFKVRNRTQAVIAAGRQP